MLFAFLVSVLTTFLIRDEKRYTKAMNEITIGDKIYISAKRAAEITGYARDYVGQLCREGHIDAKMVGRSWYVFEPSIRSHRFGGEAVSTPDAASSYAQADKALQAVGSEGASHEGSGSVHTANTTWKAPKYTLEPPVELPELPKPVYEELLPPPQETLTDMQAAWKEWFERKQSVLETPEIESPEVIDARAAAKSRVEQTFVAEEDEHEDAEAADEDEEFLSENADEDEIAIPLHQIQNETVYFEAVPPDQESVRQHIQQQRRAYEREEIRPVTPPYSSYQSQETSLIDQEPIVSGRIISERVVRSAATTSNRKQTIRQHGRSSAPMAALLIGISLFSIAIALIGTGKAQTYLRTLPSENPVINFFEGQTSYKR
jgi:hypothetical protein